MLVLALAEVNKPESVLALALACLMFGVIVGAAREQRRDTAGSELQRHLARCRRRGESATVMVAMLAYNSQRFPMRLGAARR